MCKGNWWNVLSHAYLNCSRGHWNMKTKSWKGTSQVNFACHKCYLLWSNQPERGKLKLLTFSFWLSSLVAFFSHGTKNRWNFNYLRRNVLKDLWPISRLRKFPNARLSPDCAAVISQPDLIMQNANKLKSDTPPRSLLFKSRFATCTQNKVACPASICPIGFVCFSDEFIC